MKKYITAAALLVAGTALSNAANVDQTYDESAWQNGTITLDTALDLSDSNWTISVELTMDPEVAGSGEYGTRFFYSSSANVPGVNNFSFWLGSKKDGTWANFGNVNFRGLGTQSGEADYQVDDASGKRLKLDAGTYTFSVVRDGDQIALSIVDSSNVYAPLLQNVKDVSSGMTGTISAFSTGVDLTKSGWTLPKVTISTTGFIPEPSAFGLLAGAGALALVAARRRRRAK